MWYGLVRAVRKTVQCVWWESGLTAKECVVGSEKKKTKKEEMSKKIIVRATEGVSYAEMLCKLNKKVNIERVKVNSV